MFPLSVVDLASNCTVVTNLVVNFGFAILSHEDLNFYPIKTEERVSLMSLPFNSYLVTFLMGRNLSVYEERQASFTLNKHPTPCACYILPPGPRFETTDCRAPHVLVTFSCLVSCSLLHSYFLLFFKHTKKVFILGSTSSGDCLLSWKAVMSSCCSFALCSWHSLSLAFVLSLCLSGNPTRALVSNEWGLMSPSSSE